MSEIEVAAPQTTNTLRAFSYPAMACLLLKCCSSTWVVVRRKDSMAESYSELPLCWPIDWYAPKETCTAVASMEEFISDNHYLPYSNISRILYLSYSISLTLAVSIVRSGEVRMLFHWLQEGAIMVRNRTLSAQSTQSCS